VKTILCFLFGHDYDPDMDHWKRTPPTEDEILEATAAGAAQIMKRVYVPCLRCGDFVKPSSRELRTIYSRMAHW